MEADAAKTSFLQAVKRPVYRDPRVPGMGMLWRGHANQGRCQPGRRAVLEETSYVSDHFQFYPVKGIFTSAEIG